MEEAYIEGVCPNDSRSVGIAVLEAGGEMGKLDIRLGVELALGGGN